MSVFDLPWLPMPQQQQFPPQGGGHESAGHGGSGEYGGGDQGDGGEPGTAPARDPQDDPNRAQTAVSVMDSLQEALGLSDDEFDENDVKVGISDDGLTANVKGQTRENALEKQGHRPQGYGIAGFIANALNGLMGTEFDFDGNMRDYAGERDAREAHDAERGQPGDDPDPKAAAGPKDDEDPKWTPGTKEYREHLLEVMERLLGNMPDGNYEVPDWSVIFAQDNPDPPPPSEAPQPREVQEAMGQYGYQTFFSDMEKTLREEVL